MLPQKLKRQRCSPIAQTNLLQFMKILKVNSLSKLTSINLVILSKRFIYLNLKQNTTIGAFFSRQHGTMSQIKRPYCPSFGDAG